MEIKELKAEIFDILLQQNELQNKFKELEQQKLKKMEELKKELENQ